MAKEIKLPQLGQTMEEGTVVTCLTKIGEQVNKGDIIFEIETDKATLEMESPAEGFVKHIFVEAGQTLPVGDPLLVLGEKDEQVPQSFIDSLTAAAEPAAAAPTPAPAAVPTQAQAQPSKKVKASPRAKKLAKQLGVNIETIAGTGPDGRITEDDIKKAAESTSQAPAPEDVKLGQTIPLNRLQKITAQKMLQSKHEIPCFYLTVKADVTELVALRTETNKTSDVKISYNDFIIRAVALGLEKYRIMTGQALGDNIQLAGSINIGLAISVPDGLVAPILKDVNKKNLTQIARDSQAIIEKARNNKLSPDDLAGGCITVSNLGAFGIESFIPIVVPGQCSILGIGQITDTCIPENGNIIVRKLMTMTLSVDHKVANGAYAAQFLDSVRQMLQDPENLA